MGTPRKLDRGSDNSVSTCGFDLWSPTDLHTPLPLPGAEAQCPASPEKRMHLEFPAKPSTRHSWVGLEEEENPV